MRYLGYLIVIVDCFLSSWGKLDPPQVAIYSIALICGTTLIVVDRLKPIDKKDKLPPPEEKGSEG